MSSIRSIGKGDIHRICSGQVIVDLCSAVKEIVENSLDAKATKVEVRLNNFGFDSFEVIDDGTGISKENRESVCLKHWTSKLNRFEDLVNVSSFGFRGEALSSLCEVSNSLIITTRCVEDDHAVKLVYDRNGRLQSTTVAARAVGTSILVTNLFEKLPVRRKDFEKNLKKQYSNLLYLLQAYAIISSGVKLSVINFQQKDGKKTTAIATQGADKMGSNLASIFGHKFLEEVESIELSFSISTGKKKSDWSPTSEEDNECSASNEDPSQTSTASSSVSSRGESIDVRVIGYVSKSKSGIGRSGTDRQFFFVNGRPADLKKFSKALNDVWRQYEMNHKPACALDVILPPGSFDVNVTPDKREILIEKENDIIEKFKEKLNFVWEPTKFTFQQQHQQTNTLDQVFERTSSQKTDRHEEKNKDDDTSPLGSTEIENETITMERDIAKIKEVGYHILEKDFIQSETGKPDRVMEEANNNKQEQVRIELVKYVDETSPKEGMVQEGLAENSRLMHEKDIITEHLSVVEVQKVLEEPNVEINTSINESKNNGPGGRMELDQHVDIQNRKRVQLENSPTSSSCCGGNHMHHHEVVEEDNETDLTPSRKHIKAKSRKALLIEQNSPQISEEGEEKVETTLQELNNYKRHKLNTPTTEIKRKNVEEEDAEVVIVAHPKGYSRRNKTKQSTLHVGSAKELLEAYESKRNKIEETPATPNSHTFEQVDVTSTIDEETAVAKLESVFNKSDFLRAEIIGQFNLGFIIAKVMDDLFILDQHASDEKFRFETLQKSTTIHEQPLIVPLPIDLTATEAQVVRDHIPIFQANGFHIEDDETNPNRVLLTRIPQSKQTTFGVEDVRELASLLRENPPSEGGVIPRLPKLRTMFASRACRSAIMIGDSLPINQMVKVVANLATLQQPWNCPHGRPTMRHLANLPELHQKTKTTML